MKDFNIYSIGGAGINVMNLYLEEGKNGEFIDKIIAVDTSEANPITSGLFHLERIEGAEGSGGDKKAHRDKYPDFTKQLLSKFPPNKLNIVVFSLSGGTGAGLGPYLARWMLERKIPVLLVCIGDTTTVNEQNNTISTLGSLYNQTKLGNSVLFGYNENTPNVTQGEVNKRTVAYIDNAIMMLNLNNERIDYADIKNLFYYTDLVDADPILTQLTFMDESGIPEYKSTPVAAISLYSNINEISSPFENMLYRKAGIFGNSYKGNRTQVHAVLDHGDTLENIKGMIAKREAKTNELAGRFKNKSTDIFGNDADDDGMM